MKNKEELFQTYKEIFNHISKNFPGIIWICLNDEHYTPVYLSDKIEDIYGYPKINFLSGKVKFTDIIYPEDLEQVNVVIAEAVEKKKSYKVEMRYRRPDGSTVRVLEIGEGVFNKENKLEYLIGATFDITEYS